MQYNTFQELQLSRLGFGTMRLPLDAAGNIDEVQVGEMVDYAMSHGVNYFDTAYPYHGGMSEVIISRTLQKYPRESFYLATKYPGHQIAERYDPADVFEKQLKKCGVEYFDFYLLHNVCENSMDVYLDPQWGIIDYFLEQKRLGRIKHLGFSSHARPENLKAFLDLHGDKMEFCQIQLNYLDWTLQDAKTKYEMLTERNIPVWVMEPIRGGHLAKLRDDAAAQLHALRPAESNAAWSIRWLLALPNVKMILSGMSNMEQMIDNVNTFSQGEPLTKEESDLLLQLAEQMKNALPCTACRYCCDDCPMGLDIPMLIHAYNDIRTGMGNGMTVSMQLDALPADKLPSACLSCGACAAICPQKIDIPAAMADFSALIPKLPNWKQICREREEAAEKLNS